ncbi:MAG: methyltransferase cognate corrinoid protein [Desulfobacterales bacterium]|nr:methyltransferase cognate corrinoid protein [Desulfobacterales bacterium]
MQELIFSQAKEAIKTADQDKVKQIAEMALTNGMDPAVLLEQGFVAGITEIGELFEAEKIFLPELVMAADAMKIAADICNRSLGSEAAASKGKVILGTVKGDIHDIGKSIVASFLSASGFEVIDLGRDVVTQAFIDKAVELDADVIATSALLTTTMGYQEELENSLKEKGLKGKFKTIIGGAPVNQGWADKIGADAYAEDAASAAQTIKEMLA